ncbi:MAG: hypothetical protein FJ303_21515 [Planctomycetes bacterium]|nr:hypothetical protein [Planctomycetota bacterium]
MKRLLRIALVAWAPILALGCQNLNTAFDAPPVIPLTQQPIQYRNPDLIPWPKDQYRRLYEAALEVLFDYGFEIAEANLYSGDIEAVPRTSPGIGLLLKPGSPDMYDRLLSTLQSYRHRVTIKIQPADRAPADHGGYIVEFIVRKELEDVARPIRSSVGGAVFRSENTVERQTEVIDATFLEPSWIFRGRDCGLEQEMIRRFKHALARPVCN